MKEKEIVLDDLKKKKNKFLNKLKRSINKIIEDTEIEANYKKNSEVFAVYKKDSVFSTRVYGHIFNDYIEIYGRFNIEENNIIVRKLSNIAYSITKIENTTMFLTGNHSVKEKESMKVYIKDDLKEINAIKVKDKYYLLDK